MSSRLLTALWLLVVFHAPVSAQVAVDSLVIRVEGQTPRVFRAAELRALPHDTLRSTMPHGEGFFRGARFMDVLRLAGIPMDSVRGPMLSDFVVVEAADGYRVVFGLSELAEDISGRHMLLADEMDGHSLPSFNGPWQLIVPGDRRATRWIRQVISVTIRRAP